MGVKNELDLLLGETKENFEKAKNKTDKGLIQYSQDQGEVKKDK